MPFEPLDQYLQRKKKLAEIEALGEAPIRTGSSRPPRRRERSSARYGRACGRALEAEAPSVRVAGRILTLRLHGKAGFAHIQGAGSGCRFT